MTWAYVSNLNVEGGGRVLLAFPHEKHRTGTIILVVGEALQKD